MSFVPINKGNYAMESPLRLARWDDCLGEGWADDYRAYRRAWSDHPRRGFVADYPLLVDLELSTACNLRCPMCYTTTERFQRTVRPALMDFDLFTRMVDEIAGHVPALRLSLRGEPMLHPRFLDAVRHAKRRGLREVSTLTNGSRLTPGYCEQLVEAGLDWLTVSVDGLADEYDRIRRPLTFDGIVERLRELKALKDRLGVRKPVVKVQAIWPAIRGRAQLFYETFAPITDQVAFNPLIDYLGNDEQLVHVDQFRCPQHYQRLVVGADGRVMMCSNDEYTTVPVGDARTQSIHEIWHGEPLEAMRRRHRQPRGFAGVELCRHCYLPRVTDTSERAVIDGRDVAIENYVGRSQVVGT
jgi:radical SAM protein with 4Fe4S-binding SPASM domain